MPTDRPQKYSSASWLKRITATAAILAASATSAHAGDIPDFMKIVEINEGAPTAKSQIADNSIYALNDGMFSIYDHSLSNFQANFRSRQNLIMGLFSGKGGRFILYRAGQPPLEAPSPPPAYALAKSVGHCAMGTYDLVAPFCANSASDLSWKPEMIAYRARVQSATDALDAADLTQSQKDLMRDALHQVAAFMDKCLTNNSFTYTDVETYAHGIKPDLVKLIGVASSTQVAHWFKVMEEWKALLGKDWDTTYGLSNSIYVARQNNILFSVMVQFFGEKAMNDRLLLLETTDFTATPDAMFGTFMRIISDRALGKVFYNDYHMMDYELLGGGGRQAITTEATKRGWKPLLPPLVPYNSTQWPMKIDPNSGTGPALLEDIH